MPIAMGIPAIMALAGVGGGIASGIAANSAANTQANAANNAANVSRHNATDALNFQRDVFNTQQQNMAPWLNVGGAANYNLARLMGLNVPQGQQQPNWNGGGMTIPGMLGGGSTNPNPSGNGQAVAMNAYGGATPMTTGSSVPMTGLPGAGGLPGGVMPMGGGAVNMSAGGTGSMVPMLGGNNDFGSLAQGFNEQFQAPTNVTEQNDPGFQFRLQQGMDALQRSAAARGGLLSGGTAKALNDYAQNQASNEYGNVYNRALGEYQQRYNIFNQNQANLFNRYAALSGQGQVGAGQLNSAGSSAAGNVGNILLGSAGQIGNDITGAGNARASGYVGVGNAVSGTLGNLGNIALLNQLGAFK